MSKRSRRATRALLLAMTPGALLLPVLNAPPAGATVCPSGVNHQSEIDQNVNWTSCNLSGMDFTSADLTNAILTKANVTGTIFRWATFTGIESGKLSFTTPPTLPTTDWEIVADANGSNFFVGPGANETAPTNANFQSVDLTSPQVAVLAGANLNGVNLSNANVSGVDFTGANLNGANLHSATITNAKFAGASFNNTESGGTLTGSPASLPDTQHWEILTDHAGGRYFIGPQVNASAPTPADFTGMHLDTPQTADLQGASLQNVTFTNTYLTNVNMVNANLTNAVLAGANLSGANLSGATMTNVFSGIFGGVTGSPSPSLPQGWQIVNGYLVGPGANLTAAALQGQPTVLQGANLRGANLNATNLSGSNLTGAVLSATTMDIVWGYGTNITGTQFSGANFNNLQSLGVVGTASLPSQWLPIADPNYPTGATYTNMVLVGPAVNGGMGANLGGLNLSGMDFSGYCLTNAVLTGATLSASTQFGSAACFSGIKSGNLVGTPGSVPAGWRTQPVAGFLIGQTAYLENANLHGQSLVDAPLSNADLTNANLSNANLSGAVLNGAVLSSASLTGTNLGPDGATCTNLQSANLSNAALTGATVTCADFTATTMNNVAACTLNGTPGPLPQYFVFAGQCLLGPSANDNNSNFSGTVSNLTPFSHMYWPGIKFKNTVLQYVDFTSSTLTNANFTGANLTGSVFTGADTTGAIWSNTVCPDGSNSTTNAGGSCYGHGV